MGNNLSIHAKPILKWAGGKSQMLKYILPLIPNYSGRYIEPFLGGGAVYFALNPDNAIISDSNPELINMYRQVADNVESVIMYLNKYKNDKELFYAVREQVWENLPKAEAAARMIFLNKTCFNGLYRVNSKNEFNVPFGKKTKVNTYEGQNLGIICGFLNYNDIKILSTDFEEAVKEAKKGDFIYFDPPYDSDTSTFNSYTEDGFGKEQQKRLARVYRELSDKGCYVMLSNHNTELINELYKDYNIHLIEAKRSINANGKKRGKVEEVIITNYENKRGFDL